MVCSNQGSGCSGTTQLSACCVSVKELNFGVRILRAYWRSRRTKPNKRLERDWTDCLWCLFIIVQVYRNLFLKVKNFWFQWCNSATDARTSWSDSCEIFSTVAIEVQNFISLMIGQALHVIATKSALLEYECIAQFYFVNESSPVPPPPNQDKFEFVLLPGRLRNNVSETSHEKLL